ncbi:MAG TPA: cell division protein ZapA [Kiloniellales bacterium]|nr:cell division protein ZapA [Kiloniellales bacterium]
MGKLSVSINGRDYEFSCEDGQEEHLGEMAEVVNKRVKEVASAVGQVGEPRLLVMTALLLADELSDAYAELERRQQAGVGGSEATLAKLAHRLERLASRMARA